MSCLTLLLLLAMLVIVCSLQEPQESARTPREVFAAARQMGVTRTTGKVLLALLIVMLLIASAFPLSVATQLANLGGMR